MPVIPMWKRHSRSSGISYMTTLPIDMLDVDGSCASESTLR